MGPAPRSERQESQASRGSPAAAPPASLLPGAGGALKQNLEGSPCLSPGAHLPLRSGILLKCSAPNLTSKIYTRIHTHTHTHTHTEASQVALVVKKPACQFRRLKRLGFNPWVRKISWRRAWQPTLVFLPGEFHGQRSLVGYSPWGHKE